MEIGRASLLKVKLLGCDPNAHQAIPEYAKQDKPQNEAQVMEAGPCEFYLLVPGRLGAEEVNIEDYVTFQRTRKPIKTIFQTENVFKLLYTNEGDLKGFMPEKRK